MIIGRGDPLFNVRAVSLRYRVFHDKLVVFDGWTARYRRRPDGYAPEKVLAVPDSRDAIALLRYSEEGAPAHFPNLVRVRPDGEIQWRGMPPALEPGVHDSWLAFRWAKSGGLSANSWSGFYCKIDPETGTIISAEFTK